MGHLGIPCIGFGRDVCHPFLGEKPVTGKVFRVRFDYFNHPLVTPERLKEAVHNLRQSVDSTLVLTTEPPKDDAGRPLTCLLWVQKHGPVTSLVRASLEQRFQTKLEEVDND